MNLGLEEKLIVVGGATSGFGRAIAEALLIEGAKVIGIARSGEKLKELGTKFPESFEYLVCDITSSEAPALLLQAIGQRTLYGILINAGGPPAKTTLETTLQDWDDAYHKVLRWKIDLTQQLIPLMLKEGVGRFIYIESASVKQPMENLVLSNAFRVAAVGFVKTISQELAGKGITFNVMAPGSHATAANERVVNKKMEQTQASKEEILNQLIRQTTVGRLGTAEDFASLACWLFSTHSGFINGQTISVDGGLVKGIMG